MPLLTLPIEAVHVETPRTRLVRLPLAGARFDFCAGQSARVGRHGQSLRKPYSIACSPEQVREAAALELLIQVTAEGSAGTHIGLPAAGAVLDIDGPTGDFCFPADPPQRDFLFVAGGTGIAPLRSMLWHVLAAYPDCRCALSYSARAPEEFAFGNEMRGLATSGRILLRETVTREASAEWTGARGRITGRHVAGMLTTPDTLCFVCGPPAMVQDVTAWLRVAGVATEQILSEGWA